MAVNNRPVAAGGDHWQSLQRDLPTAWVRDLPVHDNDLTPVRQATTATLDAPVHLYTPLPPETPLPTAAGAHRFVRDLRYTRPNAIEYDYSIAATWDSDTPLTPGGPLVLPGTYQLVLTPNGKDYRATLKMMMDPREHVDRADPTASVTLSRQVGDALQHVRQTWGQVEAVREQLHALDKQLTGNTPLRHTAQATQAKTKTLVSGSCERSTNLSAVSDALAAIATDLEGADRAPTDGQRQAMPNTKRNIDKALTPWRSIQQTDLPPLDKQLQSAGMKAIKLPTSDQIKPRVPEAR